MVTDAFWKLMLGAANEVLVLGVVAYLMYRLARIWVNRYFDYLEKQTPRIDRAISMGESVAAAVHEIARMMQEDHRILFASIRGLQHEMAEFKETYGADEKASH